MSRIVFPDEWEKDEWYGFDADRGFFLKKDAPPEAVESFKKWAAYQDKLNGEGYSYSAILREENAV